MQPEQQVSLFEEFTTKQRDVLINKRSDYALSDDVMSNFKQVSNITNLTPEQSILVLIATKVARLGNLFSNKDKKVVNESIDDSILDLANYSFLLACAREETKQSLVRPTFSPMADDQAFEVDAGDNGKRIRE